MQLHELTPKTKSSSRKRVGRGGKRGKTSGKGHKGQKARAGGTPRPELRDLIKKIPKLRGHGKNRAKTVNAAKTPVAVVSLSALSREFKGGEIVSPHTLLKKGVIEKRGDSLPNVKILANGEITKAVSVKGCATSEAARTAIEAAGGSVVN